MDCFPLFGRLEWDVQPLWEKRAVFGAKLRKFSRAPNKLVSLPCGSIAKCLPRNLHLARLRRSTMATVEQSLEHWDGVLATQKGVSYCCCLLSLLGSYIYGERVNENMLFRDPKLAEKGSTMRFSKLIMVHLGCTKK